MNIAVVDDAGTDRNQLLALLQTYGEENSIMLTLTAYPCGKDFLEQADLATLDAVFLDIFMKDLDGLEVAQRIRKQDKKCQLVFITNTEAYAYKSYEVRAFDYLLKPVNYDKICKVMQLLEENLVRSSRFLIVKEGRELRRVLLDDIIYADYSNHYVQIHTKNDIICTYSKFSEFEHRLDIYPFFLTCYRNILINMKEVEKIDGRFFLMKNGEYIPINHKRDREIKEQYGNYIFKEMDGE